MWQAPGAVLQGQARAACLCPCIHAWSESLCTRREAQRPVHIPVCSWIWACVGTRSPRKGNLGLQRLSCSPRARVHHLLATGWSLGSWSGAMMGVRGDQ